MNILILIVVIYIFGVRGGGIYIVDVGMIRGVGWWLRVTEILIHSFEIFLFKKRYIFLKMNCVWQLLVMTRT